MKYFTRLAVAATIIMLPVFASADTSADLAAQAQALLNQVAALQAQLAAQGGVTTGTSSGSTPVTSGINCPLIGRVLKLGSSGDDVARLQKFLATDPSVYPEGQATGYYGTLTEAAVKRWQVKYNIVASGSAVSTGYGVTGPRTAAAISLQCSTASGGGASSGPVGGFIQVSPVSGNAPLTVSVKATVNTTGSCTGGSYALSWGDGTVAQSLTVPTGSCGQVLQNYSHQYIYGGVYMVTLSAGTHQTSATVVVSGPSAPNAGGTSIVPLAVSVTSPINGASVQRGDKITISWNTTGTVPANSSIALDLYTASGQKAVANDMIAITSQMSGSMQWTIPGTAPAGTACTAVYPGGLCGATLANGSYVIRAAVAQSTNGTSSGNVLASGNSGTITLTGTAPTPASNYKYGPLTVTPNVSGNPLSTSASFDIPTSCTGYDLSWGDGTSDIIQANSTSCAAGAVSRSFTHQYAGNGSYTIYARRGADLSQGDSVSLVISN
ncbi:MAG: hypothetical protein JWM46_481 [Candidatus Kaiserbacteria bacterium]|nr:hypothetical protein [Candidatus Kaiserbacteria bacterium]